MRKVLRGLAVCGVAVLVVAASANAQMVEVSPSGEATAIKNINIIYANNTEPVLSDVDFLVGTAAEIYGENFDFDILDDESVAGAAAAINNVLSAANPVPMVAGENGYSQFFVGEDIQTPIISAVGGEYFSTPDLWERCDTNEPAGPEGEECILGVASITEIEVRVWAKISPAPEPGVALSAVAMLGTLGMLARRRH